MKETEKRMVKTQKVNENLRELPTSTRINWRRLKWMPLEDLCEQDYKTTSSREKENNLLSTDIKYQMTQKILHC